MTSGASIQGEARRGLGTDRHLLWSPRWGKLRTALSPGLSPFPNSLFSCLTPLPPSSSLAPTVGASLSLVPDTNWALCKSGGLNTNQPLQGPPSVGCLPTQAVESPLSPPLDSLCYSPGCGALSRQAGSWVVLNRGDACVPSGPGGCCPETRAGHVHVCQGAAHRGCLPL